MSKLRRISAFILVFILTLSIGIVGISAASEEVAEVAGASDKPGITVYFKSEDVVPYIYYWNALPQNLEVEYPGVKMTPAPEQEGGNWYKYTFEDSTKIVLIIINPKSVMHRWIRHFFQLPALHGIAIFNKFVKLRKNMNLQQFRKHLVHRNNIFNQTFFIP